MHANSYYRYNWWRLFEVFFTDWDYGIFLRFKIKKKNPHLCKINPKFGYAGEDSYFREQIDKCIFFGCADGVYEWNERGVSKFFNSQLKLSFLFWNCFLSRSCEYDFQIVEILNDFARL